MDSYQEGPSTAELDSAHSRRTLEDTVVLSPNALKALLTECLSSWVNYLQILNSLCSAGFKLSQCLGSLAQFQTVPLASQCQSSWEELAKATIIASNTVKTHIAATMQDMIIGETYTESDAQRQQEHNQHIIFENLLTFINLQYQFSIASCECFGPVATCPCCQTVSGGVHNPDCTMASLQQCFARMYTQDTRSQTSSPHSGQPGTLDSPKTQHLPVGERGSSPSQAVETRGSSPLQAPELGRGPSPIQSFIDTIRSTVTSHIENLRGPFPTPGALHTMKSPFLRGSRSPLHFPLFPLSSQRRWSEAAAGDVGAGVACRDSGDSTMRRWSMPWDCARAEAGPAWHNRMGQSATGKLGIPIVHNDRSRSNTPVEPANTSISGSDGLAEAIQLLGSRGIRSQNTHVSHPQMSSLTFGVPSIWPTEPHSEDRLHKRHHQILPHRGNWQTPLDLTQGTSVTEHYDIFPTSVPLTSRKSSSSTDSSSCLSIHSRSTSGSERGSSSDGTGAGEAIRLHTHLYSIWSGSDHLPFIRLPESQEPPDDDYDESGCMSAFPKPI